MLFNKAKQIGLLRPAKVGTFTSTHFLSANGWKSIGGPHEFLDFYLSKYPNLANYKIYCFFRDPLARFQSQILHTKQMPRLRLFLHNLIIEKGIDATLESLTYEQAIDLHPILKDAYKKIWSPQVAWFTHPNIYPLDFANFENELRKLADNYEMNMTWYNKSNDFGRSVITDKVREFVRDYYAADYAFAKDALGKEY